jgi:gluconolactonase
MMHSSRRNVFPVAAIALLTALIVIMTGCANDPEWKAVNDQLIAEKGISVRTRDDVSDSGIFSNLEDGLVSSLDNLTTAELHPGVEAKIYWGRANLIAKITMAPGSMIPNATLESERIMLMQQGSVEQMVDGEWVPMERTAVAPYYYYSTGYVGTQDVLYTEPGAMSATKAGPEGAVFFEYYYPIRLDYKAHTAPMMPNEVNFGSYDATPSLEPNKVYNVNEIPLTELVENCYTRLINGRGVQVSVLWMLPGAFFDYHNHPEEQLMTVVRGSVDEIILDGTHLMEVDSILYLPAQMVHGGELPETGCDAIDVFFPVRADYQKKAAEGLAAFHAIIPEGTEPKLIAEGFKFTEGPTWLDGKYYFSSMFFDIPAGTWKSDAKKSDLISMTSDGSWDYVLKGKMQTNGLMANARGNIVACDMAGHRMLELSKNGRIVKVLATKLPDGTRLDGPNDLVMDAKGGIYFTDPQFIFDTPARPGKTVNYLKANGDIIEVISPGDFGMPNGVILSPDGSKLYVNNTYHDANRMSDVENFVIVYDVNDDGTLSNKRRFCHLFLPPSEYDNGTKSTCADGMTMDELGNLYVGTNIGLQIFSPEGKYIGNIHTDTFPVSVCFGGENYDELFMTCWDKIYTIKTNVKGLKYPLGS